MTKHPSMIELPCLKQGETNPVTISAKEIACVIAYRACCKIVLNSGFEVWVEVPREKVLEAQDIALDLAEKHRVGNL